MACPSSDGFEIVSDFQRVPRPRSRPSPTPATFTSTTSLATASTFSTASALARPAYAARETSTKSSASVIELSDGSDDDVPPPPKRARRSSDADDVVIVAGPSKPTSAPPPFDASSDDLPPISAIWAAQARVGPAPALGRSASMNAATQSSSHDITSQPLAGRSRTLGSISNSLYPEASHASPPFPGFSSSPHLADFSTTSRHTRPTDQHDGPRPPFGTRAAGSDDFEPFALRPRSLANLDKDPWASILGDTTGGSGRGKGKGKGKAKANENDGRSTIGYGGDSQTELDTQETQRLSPTSHTTRVAATSGLSKKEQAAAERAAKTALKKQETLDRMKLREANTLRTKDKKLTAAEMTIHVSGRAFASSDGPASDESGGEDDGGPSIGGARQRGKKKQKKAPSPWLEITSLLQERMQLYNCDVECPESPRRDVGSEGAIRWTRTCDRKWDEERNMYVPLANGETIVVEEDTRLVFLTAHDLSLHISRNTLESHIQTIQSSLPPHVNLFVLLFGLNTLFRDVERVVQAEYRARVRAEAGETAGGGKVKPAGIGEGQPDRDQIELAIMRMQVQSRCMIVSVDKVEEAVDWLEQISFDVGQKPYQRHKQSHITILGTTEDKLPSGKDLQDTYIKMLASLKGVTEALAKGIAGEYPTLRTLFEAWEDQGGERARKDMLIGIGKGRNVNGTATHRTIGTTMSHNIYRMMTSRDPGTFL
ncbi:hypothetical protein JCM10212_001628 [Sporobolomyces blumeae]